MDESLPVLVFSEIPRQRLRDLIARQGQSFFTSPSAEATLRAVCHGFEREAPLLVTALRAGIPARIIAAPAMPASILSDDLAESARLAPDAAAWAVESWAAAVAEMPETFSTVRQNAAPAATACAGQAAASILTPSPIETHPQSLPTNAGPPPILELRVWPPVPASGSTIGINTSGSVNPLPPEIAAKKWHWGACSLTWLWLIFHKKPLLGVITLLVGFVPIAGGLIGLVMALHFGANGYKMAWQSRRFESTDEFFAVQNRWSWWGTVVTLAATVVIAGLGAWCIYCQHPAISGMP